MLAVLLFSFLTFFALFMILVSQRMGLGDAEDRLGGIKSSLRRMGR